MRIIVGDRCQKVPLQACRLVRNNVLDNFVLRRWESRRFCPLLWLLTQCRDMTTIASFPCNHRGTCGSRGCSQWSYWWVPVKRRGLHTLIYCFKFPSQVVAPTEGCE